MKEYEYLKITGSAKISAAETSSSETLHAMLNRIPADFPGIVISRNVLRSGPLSLRSICAAAAALKQSGTVQNFSNTAIIGIGKEGAHQGNLEYWHDYTENGRIDGTACLFVSTLPSTPVCEIALVFQIHGTAYYLDPFHEKNILSAEAGLLLDEGYSRVIYLCNDNSASRVAVIEKNLAPDSGIEQHLKRILEVQE